MSLLLLACGRDVVDPPPQIEVPVEIEKVVEEPKPSPKRTANMVESAYELGRRTERLEQQTREAEAKLEEVQLVAAFIICLEERTGEEVRGDDGSLERHMRGKHGRACRRKITEMDSDEMSKYVAKAIPE